LGRRSPVSHLSKACGRNKDRDVRRTEESEREKARQKESKLNLVNGKRKKVFSAKKKVDRSETLPDFVITPQKKKWGWGFQKEMEGKGSPATGDQHPYNVPYFWASMLVTDRASFIVFKGIKGKIIGKSCAERDFDRYIEKGKDTRGETNKNKKRPRKKVCLTRNYVTAKRDRQKKEAPH